MRQIVLDTETTGLDPKQGNRIIEIGCVELQHRRLTGNNFHVYLNPERDSEEGALRVHGLTPEFLSDKPKFIEVVEGLRAYLAESEVIIHNAPFDLAFLEAEFARAKLPTFRTHISGVTDSLVMAKTLHPGKRNSLDALCERYSISNAHRTWHGALLDAALLAEVYLAMTRGQDSLMMDDDEDEHCDSHANDMTIDKTLLRVLSATAEEREAHEQVLKRMARESKTVPLWCRDE